MYIQEVCDYVLLIKQDPFNQHNKYLKLSSNLIKFNLLQLSLLSFNIALLNCLIVELK